MHTTTNEFKKTPWIFLIALSFILLNNGIAHALPVLQLDIVDGYYDSSTETTVATTNPFTLQALALNPSGIYYISAAIIPRQGYVEEGLDLGSFIFNGQTIDVTEDMTYGYAPIDEAFDEIQEHDGGDLGPHDVFPTYFTEFAFTFGAETVPAYNTQTGELQVGSLLFLRTFVVDVSGLEGYQVHFDLYNEKLKACDIDIKNFAPFSHDAESGPPPVPEPATLILLGSGLLGLAGFRKNMKK